MQSNFNKLILRSCKWWLKLFAMGYVTQDKTLKKLNEGELKESFFGVEKIYDGELKESFSASKFFF